MLTLHGSAVLVGTAITANSVAERSPKDAIPRNSDQIRGGTEADGGLLQAKRRLVFDMDKIAGQKTPEVAEETIKDEERREVLVGPGRFRVPVTVKNDEATTRGCPRTLNSEVVFLVRIPKSASTSFVDLFKALSKRSFFGFHFNPSGAYNWDNPEKVKVASFVRHSIHKKPRGFVYARHFYYVNFTQYGLPNHTYVTLIRHPVSRFVSSYLYYHFSSKPHIQAILKPEHRNETLEECLRFQHSGCTHNLMTKYFCGHEEHCKSGSAQALEQAKKNLQTFAAVGIVEEMDTSLRVFKAVLPQYFSLLNLEEDKIPRLNKNEHEMSVSTTAHDAIAQYNAADMKLYKFAKQVLHQTALKCVR